MKILVIEDSERLRRSLEKGLSHAGYAVDVAGDGHEGLHFLETYEYTVLVLDLMLPGLDGLEILKRLREAGKDTHVLILSALDQVDDRVRGLAMGADDYLTKPFSFDELLARVQALVRRHHQVKSPRLTLGALALDTAARRLYREGNPIHLTPSEYALFELLAMRRGRVHSKDFLVDQLYRSDSEVSSNMIEVLISNLRKKIQPPDEPSIIRTRRGLGYLIEAP